jgi:predicted ribosome quality control (RQC) complex YloA/Tae2 family protein
MSDEKSVQPVQIHNLQKILNQQIHKLTGKYEKQLEEFEETEKHLWYKQIGDSLLARSGKPFQKGVSKLELLNVYTQTEETVPINPKLSLKENAELYFKKAKKGKRGADINNKKVELTTSELDGLKSLKTECDEFIKAKEEPPQEFIEKLTEILAKYMPAHQTISSPGKSSPKAEKVPYRHITIGEWDIYLGKTDSQNDELSTRFAKPSDLWFHVAGHAGSHVIIRRKKGDAPTPNDVIEKAAALAVWFSKAKHTSYAEVHYTEARFVHKRRHSPPGEVQIERYKSIRVSPKSPHDLFPSTFLKDAEE